MRRVLLALGPSFAALLLAASIGGVSADAEADRHDRDSSSTLVLTNNGPVQGIEASGLRKFLGIPYAMPPSGDMRWRPPVPHARWHTPLDASRFGHHCPQPESAAGQANASEDCLFLNVFTAVDTHDRHGEKPVMVWIHGGSLVTGKSDDYNPSGLIERGDVVVVTVNYRLGALGFLAHATLDSEGHKFANYGLMDQQLALEWVNRNIAAFGGNPRNVTIFGESAGGQSVTSHLVSPDSNGLFDRAIIESGAYALTLPTLSAAETQGTAFAASVGCTDQTAACLRSASVPTLIAREASVYVTAQDGQVLPESPIAAFASGHFNREPVLQGSNHDEYRLFVATRFDLATGPLAAAAYPLALAASPRVGPQNVPQVVAEYPLANYPSADLAYATAIGDGLFSCAARRSNQLLSEWVPTFAYEFNDVNAPSFLPPVSFPYGATHAFELAYLFNLTFLPAPSFTADQQKLADTMKDYWTEFATHDNPNVDGAPRWRRFHTDQDDILSLVPPKPAPESDFATRHHCAFWHALVPEFN